ncbi:MAG: hypothetical protein AAF694_13825, partial [Bacteroidota bacterium]
MEILFEQTWILFIVATLINGFLFKVRSKTYIAEKPELEKGYGDIFMGYIILGCIPWIIVGIGNLTGITQSITDYFFPRQMNPMVLAFHGTLVLIWLLSIWWVYFRGGAEFIERHPGLFVQRGLGNRQDLTAIQVKRFLPLMLLGGVIAMVMMWTFDSPVPA